MIAERIQKPPLSFTLLFGEEDEWQLNAACRGVHHTVFFPKAGLGKGVEAKRICADCTVRADCLEYALDARLEYGVFGGMNERERRLERYRREREREKATGSGTIRSKV